MGDGRRKRVVIVGGSFAGRRAHRLLSEKVDVTLIDAKGFFEYTPAALRCIAHPEHAKRCLLEQPPGTIKAAVTSVSMNSDGTMGHAELSTGERVPFDYCLLATGSSYPAPIKPDATVLATVGTRRQQFEAAHSELSAAQSVVVVGGGITGVELAAEIIGRWPGKAVTLVASQERLLERMPIAASVYAFKWLTARGVQVLLEERIKDWGDNTNSRPRGRCLVTDQGRQVRADLVYKCIGFRACSEVASGLVAAAPEAGGGWSIPVTETLQVVDQPRIFAAGDCTDSPEEKNALSADLAASLAAANILSLAQGKPANKHYPHGVCHGASRVPDISCVSLYKYHAIMQFNHLVIAGRLPVLVKLMVEFFQMDSPVSESFAWPQIRIAKGSRLLNLIWTAQEDMMVWLGKYLFTSFDLYVPL